MFQRLCKGAIQITKTAVYGDVNQTPIFSLSFETVVMFKNRVEISKSENVKSIEDITFKINNIQEEIRSSKKHIRWYRDLVHKVFCLHVFKGKDKISSMIYIEMAKVNFGEVTEVTADQLAWLNMDFQILQYQLARYRGTIDKDRDFERNCRGLKINSVIQNALETPSKVFVLSFLGKSYDFVKANLDVYKMLKSSEKGYYDPKLIARQTSDLSARELKDQESVDHQEGRSHRSKSGHHTDDEMRENKHPGKIRSQGPKSGYKKTIQAYSKHQKQNPNQIEEEFDDPPVIFKSTQKKVKTKRSERPLLREERGHHQNTDQSDQSQHMSDNSQDSSDEGGFNRIQTSKEKTKTQSKLQTSSKSSKPKPRINDDQTTAKLKSVHLQDMKKSNIAANKTDEEDSEDSFVEKIFDKVNGKTKKLAKDDDILVDLNKSARNGRGKGIPKGASRVGTMESHFGHDIIDGDEDERFNLPKGKLVAMLSRLEMKDLHRSQLYESNQAELDLLKEDMLKLAKKSQDIKTNFKSARSKLSSLEIDNKKLSDENIFLKNQVETLTKDRTEALSTSEQLQAALDTTRLELR